MGSVQLVAGVVTVCNDGCGRGSTHTHTHTHTQVDVREDEEQDVKLRECIDLLLAAGYFRARIKGLSPFDKVHDY